MNESAVKMDISEQIKEIILDIADIPSQKYMDSAKLREDLGMDSLDMVELIMVCEKDFYVNLPDKEWKLVETPRQLADLINARKP